MTVIGITVTSASSSTCSSNCGADAVEIEKSTVMFNEPRLKRHTRNVETREYVSPCLRLHILPSHHEPYPILCAETIMYTNLLFLCPEKQMHCDHHIREMERTNKNKIDSQL